MHSGSRAVAERSALKLDLVEDGCDVVGRVAEPATEPPGIGTLIHS
jgi:hypothetical protein